MLKARILISAILIPALIGIFVADAYLGESAFLLYFFCIFLAIRSCWEMTGLFQSKPYQPNFLLTSIICVLLLTSGWWTWWKNFPQPGLSAEGLVGVTYVFSVLLLFFAGAVRYEKPGQSMETLGSELLTVSYIGLLLTMTAQLRWVASAEAGYLVLGSLVIAVKCGDIGAYTLGRLFGKKKMVPKLSPGKTWMGFWGALIGAAAGACLWLHFAPPMFNEKWKPCPAVLSIIYGVILGLIGLIGDLCESLIKRDLEQKDSASLMPGFGGLLDLLDSVLYAGPVAWLLWKVLPLKASILTTLESS